MKYEIVETLYKDEHQATYIVNNSIFENSPTYLMNELIDGDFIYAAKRNFEDLNLQEFPHIEEVFYDDSKFYIIANLCRGESYESFISSNSLRMVDKLYLCEELLKKVKEIHHFTPLIQYTLCDFSNISIISRKHICFNNIYVFDKNNLNISFAQVLGRVGDIIWSIFTNSMYEAGKFNKDDIPPVMAAIIAKCRTGQYDTLAQVDEDFKSTLIYSTFMGRESLDEAIHTKVKKASTKRKMAPFVKAAVFILLLSFVSAGAWKYINRETPAFTPEPQSSVVEEKKNTKPVAKFEPNINKIYAGDTVSFLDQSVDNDLNDGVKGYNWSLSKDGVILATSFVNSLKHTFASEGNYSVALVVKDSQGESSDKHVFDFVVLPKEDIADPTGSSTDLGDRK